MLQQMLQQMPQQMPQHARAATIGRRALPVARPRPSRRCGADSDRL